MKTLRVLRMKPSELPQGSRAYERSRKSKKIQKQEEGSIKVFGH